MLRVHQLAKSYGPGPLFHSVSFTLLPGERIGLVGTSGSGKTSLLRILAGEENQDFGVVQFFPTDLRIGYQEQGPVFNPHDRLEDYIIRQEGDIAALSDRLAELAAGLANQPGSKTLQQAYNLVLSRLEQATENAGHAPAILQALALDSLPSELPVMSLSVAQKNRLALAGILMTNPQVLLLDEPTHHLDQNMLAWLEKWLLEYPGAALIVSQNRAFLDQVATGILEMDPLAKTVRRYDGNYTSYLNQKLPERHWQECHNTLAT